MAIKKSMRLSYESPKAETFSLASEGVLCDSKIGGSTDTGASWTDEVDPSLDW
jgi:hypothetical protein